MIMRKNRKKKIENQFSNLLYTLSEKLKANVAIEQAIYDCISMRKDELGREFVKSFKPNYSFEEILEDFAKRMNSQKISNTTRLIISLKKSGVGIADALEKISSEFWSIDLIEKEREEKTSLIAKMIFVNGSIFTPMMLGIIQGIFLTRVYPSIQIFITFLAIISMIIFGIIEEESFEIIFLIPISIFFAFLSFLIPIKIYLHIPLI
jgi:hypothetical protein